MNRKKRITSPSIDTVNRWIHSMPSSMSSPSTSFVSLSFDHQPTNADPNRIKMDINPEEHGHQKNSAAASTSLPNFSSSLIIPNSLSFCWRRRRISKQKTSFTTPQFLFLLLTFLCLSFAGDVVQANRLRHDNNDGMQGDGDPTASISPSSNNNNNKPFACSSVRYHYTALTAAKGITVSTQQIPKQSIAGSHLKVCAQGFTCCTASMETELTGESSKDFQRVLQDKILSLSHIFESTTSNLDRYFRELIAKSRQNLHKMFVDTYGILYQQNADVFSDLFDKLTQFYVSGDIELGHVLDDFYRTLFVRMFKIMNPQYTFSSAYWACMQPMMEQLTPFGDVPMKMKSRLKRSFVAARTMVQSLAAGRDSVETIMKVPPTSACGKALMRMMYCPHCRGLPGLKPCNNFCLNVMKGCLAEQADLDAQWNSYVQAVISLADRVQGAFSIENMVSEMDVKISEAIMIFQDNGTAISSKVFTGCDPAKFAPGFHIRRHRRWKRAPWQHTDMSIDQLKYGKGVDHYSNNGQNSANEKPNLDRLMKKIKHQVAPTKGFWKNLPYSLCNDEQVAAPAKRDSDCWNGFTRDRYEGTLVGDGISQQKKNPEVEMSTQVPNKQIMEEILNLRRATARLKRAYSGDSVNWNGKDSTAQQNGSPFSQATGAASLPLTNTQRNSNFRIKNTEFMDDEGSGSGDGEWSDLESVGNDTNNINNNNYGISSNFSVTYDSDDEDLQQQQSIIPSVTTASLTIRPTLNTIFIPTTTTTTTTITPKRLRTTTTEIQLTFINEIGSGDSSSDNVDQVRHPDSEKTSSFDNNNKNKNIPTDDEDLVFGGSGDGASQNSDNVDDEIGVIEGSGGDEAQNHRPPYRIDWRGSHREKELAAEEEERRRSGLANFPGRSNHDSNTDPKRIDNDFELRVTTTISSVPDSLPFGNNNKDNENDGREVFDFDEDPDKGRPKNPDWSDEFYDEDGQLRPTRPALTAGVDSPFTKLRISLLAYWLLLHGVVVAFVLTTSL